jgi:hypothetical protein
MPDNDSIRHPITAGDEAHERELDRHRASEQRDALNEALDRLEMRGIDASDGSSETVVELLEAVEAFERAVIASGGDLMLDTPPARQPDNPLFVLPRRSGDESVLEFTKRVRAATSRLR